MKLPKSTPMDNALQKAAELVKKNKDKTIHVVSHIDADGLAAASIISKALDREGITHTVTCIKLDQLPDITPADIIIFSDLGSNQLTWLSHLDDTPKIILDHHPPLQKICPNLIHVNPYFSNINGSSEISGAGVSYLFAKTLNPSNTDLSPLAVVGACGDMQDFGKLTGVNRKILEDGHKLGLVEYEDDILLYGRFTRPLFKSLQYFSDPFIPGISGDEYACKTLLKDLNIKTRDSQWVTLSHLSFEEKRILASELVKRSIKSAPSDLGKHIPQMIIGESYSLPQEEIRSPLRDCSEFATCLNACGRRNRVDIGIEVAKGNRGIYYQMLLSTLQDHRASIAKALDTLSQKPVTQIKKLQIMNASGVSDIIVGTCAQMLLGQNGINPYYPLMVYTPSDRDPAIFKVSARCSRLLLYKNIHLGKAISKAADAVNGEGGGHAPACGAYIPQKNLKKFTDLFAGLVSAQLT